MYAEPKSLMVDSTTFYGIIFDQIYLLPWFTNPHPPF